MSTELEYSKCDPKDGELCLCRMKPEEILVEVRSVVDVQIKNPLPLRLGLSVALILGYG